jgi:nitrous oxidase accessory protein
MNKFEIWIVFGLLFFFIPFEQQSVAAENLQQLIDETAPNSTLQLQNKTYSGPVTITKPITIIGDEQSIIQSDTTGISIRNTNDVVVKSLQFETKKAPIIIEASESIELTNLQFKIDEEAVHLQNVNNSTIANIQIEGIRDVHFSKKPNGINVSDSSDIRVDQAYITNIQDGIYFEQVENVTVTKAHVQNGRYGLHFMYGKHIELTNNTVQHNVTGFTIMVVTDVLIQNNVVEKQLALNSNGIYFYDIERATISNNVIKENTVGTVWNNVRDTTFTKNTFQSNGTVIQGSKSPTVLVQNNQFLGNILTARSDKNGFTLHQNHYDDYTGYDFDGDGYGDTPYQSYTSFGQWMVRKPVYQYYVEAPSVVLLNTLDKQLPTSAKNILVDTSPVMQIEEQTRHKQIHWIQLMGGAVAIFLLLFIWRKYR